MYTTEMMAEKELNLQSGVLWTIETTERMLALLRNI